MIVTGTGLGKYPDPRWVDRLPGDVRAEYIGGPKPVLEKLLPLWRSLPPDEIVVWLDGDDYLAHDTALEVVQAYHDNGAWVTYGQFIWRDGTIGFAAPVGPDPRTEPWRATHLRTFRAGLTRHLRDEDMRMVNGEYAGWVTDRRVMLALLEMSGPRAMFVPNVLCVYTGSISTGQQAIEEGVELHVIRAQKRYERRSSIV